MTHDVVPQGQTLEIDRLSYRPLHDYQTVNVDAWAEQWFSFLAQLDIGSQKYEDIRRIIHGQMAMRPDRRESDVDDAQFSMDILRLLHMKNPFSANAESTEERLQYEQWQQDQQLAERISRQLVRYTLEYADQYAALRVEQEAAGTDYMTGMLNRRGLVRHLGELHHITNQPVRLDPNGEQLPAASLTIIYSDINCFKWINDNLGHHVGDRVIIETAAKARTFYRQSENALISREGGDELVVILSDLSAEDAAGLAQRMADIQVDRIMGDPYQQTMQRVNEKLQALRGSGIPIRAEARLDEPAEQSTDTDAQTKHTLYINDEPLCPLYDIVTMSIGTHFGFANNLQEVEQLKRSAEETMGGAKQVFRRVLVTSRGGERP